MFPVVFEVLLIFPTEKDHFSEPIQPLQKKELSVTPDDHRAYSHFFLNIQEKMLSGLHDQIRIQMLSVRRLFGPNSLEQEYRQGLKS